MGFFKGIRVFLAVILSLLAIFTIAIGILFGVMLAGTYNLDMRTNLYQNEVALPSRLLDRNGDIITEFFSDEKRILVKLEDIPKNLIHAVLSREDKDFFTHKGVDVLRSLQVAFYYFTGNEQGGASTISQQVVRLMGYVDKWDLSLSRKFKEMWYAVQLERQFTKQEILEYFINNSPFGAGTVGVEAACQYYFKHSTLEITLAESALLVILMSAPTDYNPYYRPEAAQNRQRFVLDLMIENGYATEEEAEQSLTEFWRNFDYTRANSSAYLDNTSKADYFSEYVREQLEDYLFGEANIYTDGYTIYSTLDLSAQKKADAEMEKAYVELNEKWQNNSAKRTNMAEKYLPFIDLLSLSLDIGSISIGNKIEVKEAIQNYNDEINPFLELLTLGMPDMGINKIFREKRVELEEHSKKTVIEGGLITLDTHTGQIIAMVGGSDFEIKEFNRAVDAMKQPGSSFKPLYYSAGIKSRQITPATMLMDAPIALYTEDGDQYVPDNFRGTWEGPVLAWYALATSMNVPSIQVMDIIGFDNAFETASRLLGIYEQRDNEEVFPRVYPVALGIISASPIMMARAYATFGNQGREVVPYGIRYVEDRHGERFIDFEKELLSRQEKKRPEEIQILTPQEAYVMETMLQATTRMGTLATRVRDVDWDLNAINLAGKTGTTDNWEDAWTVGFTEYYTTAMYFGFDQPGLALGTEITGATGAGPHWAAYMKALHEDKEPIKFVKPSAGIITRKVCAKSGMLVNEGVCDEGTVELTFLIGTEPKTVCTWHVKEDSRDKDFIQKAESLGPYIDIKTPEGVGIDPKWTDLYGPEKENNLIDGNSLLGGNNLLGDDNGGLLPMGDDSSERIGDTTSSLLDLD